MRRSLAEKAIGQPGATASEAQSMHASWETIQRRVRKQQQQQREQQPEQRRVQQRKSSPETRPPRREFRGK